MPKVHRKIRNSGISKTLRPRKTISLLLLIIIVKIETSLVKLSVGLLREIFLQIRKANKANSLIPKQLIVILLLSKRKNTKINSIWARSSVISIRKKLLCQQITIEKAKKLVLVLATSTSITEAGREIKAKASKELKLQPVFCIYYLTRSGRYSIKTLLDSISKVNAI